MSENHLVIVRDRIVFREEADFEIQRTEVNKTKSAATDADILNEAFILLFLLMKLYFIFGFVQVIPLKNNILMEETILLITQSKKQQEVRNREVWY